MIISLKKKKIIIEDISKLKNYHKNQLNFWGYKTENQKYEIEPKDLKDLLLKTTRYFNNKSMNFSLNNEAKKLLNSLSSQKKDFDNLLNKGKLYKKNKYDDKKLKEFTIYLKKNPFRKLKKHQIKAARHMYLVENGANFSVPGSGKTSVVLSVYEKLKLEGKVDKLFIVGPLPCFEPWKNEFFSTLGREAKTHLLAGGNSMNRKMSYFGKKVKSAELLLTSFQTLLQDQDDVLDYLKNYESKIFLVIDEAHYIKRPNGNWANAVLALSKFSSYRCVLTGTPMPRSYTDIFNLFDFLWPENNPIEEINKIKIEQFENNKDNLKAKALLDKKIGPLFYRVKKSDLGLKKPLFHEPIIIEMNDNEKILYHAIENRIIEFAKEDVIKNYDLVRNLRRGRIMRLRQCVSYAKLLSTAIENYKEDILNESSLTKIITDYDKNEIPAKIIYLLEFIKKRQSENKKVLIWSNFIGTLDLINETLEKSGIKSEIICGRTPIEQDLSIKKEKTREKIRERFLDINSGLDVLIANPAALAESVSLHTSCHTAVYYDLSYNCAQYLQSLDRIHRVGGSEKTNTHYYFLQYKDTIDQDILKNLKQKTKKMMDVIEDDLPVIDLNMTEENEDEEAYNRLYNKSQPHNNISEIIKLTMPEDT